MVSVDKLKPIHIKEMPLDESQVMLGSLAAHTFGNFHEVSTLLKKNNTPNGIMMLLIEETIELLKEIEKPTLDRINMVAELGDLVHLWNDLWQLSGVPVATLLTSFGLEASNEVLTIAQAKAAAASLQKEGEIDPRNLLYELRGTIIMSELDEELVGTIAIYILAAAAALDVNIIYAALMKNQRNIKKYDPQKMDQLSEQGLTYLDIKEKMSATWNNGLGGDEQFFKDFIAIYPVGLSYAPIGQLATD